MISRSDGVTKTKQKMEECLVNSDEERVELSESPPPPINDIPVMYPFRFDEDGNGENEKKNFLNVILNTCQ